MLRAKYRLLRGRHLCGGNAVAGLCRRLCLPVETRRLRRGGHLCLERPVPLRRPRRHGHHLFAARGLGGGRQGPPFLHHRIPPRRGLCRGKRDHAVPPEGGRPLLPPIQRGHAAFRVFRGQPHRALHPCGQARRDLHRGQDGRRRQRLFGHGSHPRLGKPRCQFHDQRHRPKDGHDGRGNGQTARKVQFRAGA